MKVGKTIRVHPASDWFMKGETYATVVSIGERTAKVRGHRSKIKFTLPFDLIMNLKGEVIQRTPSGDKKSG